jgi:hypothetical protein
MQIYNKIVIDMTTGETIESDSFEYIGEVAWCWTGAAIIGGAVVGGLMSSDSGGGGSTAYPGMSAAEAELLELQLERLKQSGADAEALRPYILAGMGFKEVEGEMVKMTDDEYYESLSGLDQKSYDVAMAAAERSLKAYAGELDISPALEKSLGQRKEELEVGLSQKLGSDWQSTTAGIQAMAQFDETSNLIREEVRSGIITNEGAMTLASLDYMSGISDKGMAAFPGQQAGGVFGGAGALAGQYGQERYKQWQASAMNQQQKSQRQSGLMSGFGQLVGSGITAYGIAAASSKELKGNITVITDAIRKLKALRGVEFDWKSIPFTELSGLKGHDIGVIAEELEEIIPEAVPTISGYKHVEYHKIIPLLIEAIKEQQIQIDELKRRKMI